VASALESAVCVGGVEVHLLHCLSRVSADALRHYFAKEGSQACGVDEALPGVFVWQPSLIYAKQTQPLTSSLRGPQCMVS
jgi:hypothetical protein